MMKQSVMIGMLAFLVGCADAYIGKGPVTLSSGAQRNFEEFQKRPFPGFFALTEDGRGSFYSYCESSNCYAEPMATMVKECQSRWKQTCKIYADKRTVVWKFDEIEPAAGQ